MNKKRKGKLGTVLVILLIIAVFLGGFYYFISVYSVKNVVVEGIVLCTKEEIEDIVMEGPLGKNSKYLEFKYRNGSSIEGIPFIDALEVTVTAPDTIKIKVYEKSLSGYIEFMDSYMYFDRDGYMVKTAKARTAGIPQIVGLDFNHVVLGEKIPVKDDKVFESVMRITNLLERFALNVDKIYFQSDMDIVLYFQDVKVILGPDVNLEEKIMVLPTFLGNLEGKKGTLHMEDYTEDSDLTVFEADEIPAEN